MPLIQENLPMDKSSFFVQGSYSTTPENVAIGTPNNVSPNHHASLNLSHSNSEASIQQSANSVHHNQNNSNERSSPLHLASMLHSLSISGGTHPNMPQPQHDVHSIDKGSYLLKLKNLPRDITIRETYAIFALANGVSNVELITERKNSTSSTSSDFELSIIAKFGSLPLVTHYASILSSKSDIFGPAFPFTTYVEVIDEMANHPIPFQSSKYQPPQPNYQLSTSAVPVTPVSSIQQQPQQQQQQQQQASPVSSSGTVNRPNLMQTRSRFSFNDPFTSESSQQGQQLNEQSQQQQQQKSQSQTGAAITHSRSHQDSQSTDVGKSFLLMENDDINDSIWGSTAMPTSMNGFSSTPQPSTPILEWGTSGRKPSSSFFLSQTANAVGQQQTVPQSVDGAPSIHGITSSTPTGTAIPPSFPLMSQVSPNGPSNVLGNQDVGGAQRKHGVFISNAKQQQQDQQQQQQQEQSSSQGDTPQKGSQVRPNLSRSAHSTNGTQKTSVSTSSSSTNVASSTTISQADLSLLARVPPPANPADQNPPCNTLYVGNLPPDATEQELRQLFSAQQGFRRLSFRNKNSNGNGHGPMCFVEFDDVSFATRALAELYGSQLPRASTSNKGGIRLSFSKNPLGVRGPNNRRGGSSTAVNNPTSSNSGSNSAFNNYSYSSGYNKA